MDIKSALLGCQWVPSSQCTGINGGSEVGGGRGAKPAYNLSPNSPECETIIPHRHQHLFCFCSKLKSPYPEIPLSPALYNQILLVPQRIDQLPLSPYSSMPSPFTQIRNTIYLSLHGKQMGKQWKQCQTLFLGGSKITADGDCSHEIKRRLLLGRKVMNNLDSIFKSRDITLPTKVRLVKAMVFPVVMYGCES